MKCEECPHYIPCMKYEINDPKLKCPPEREAKRKKDEKELKNENRNQTESR